MASDQRLLRENDYPSHLMHRFIARTHPIKVDIIVKRLSQCATLVTPDRRERERPAFVELSPYAKGPDIVS